MIVSLKGELLARGENHIIVGMSGLGLKVFIPKRMLSSLPSLQSHISIFTHLNVKEDALDLYGFENPEELRLFELLISVSGVGPKSAIAILDVAELHKITAAIQEGRADLLTQASGIGRKTAERIILELKSKVYAPESEVSVKSMEANNDLVETLFSLGYRKEDARFALEGVEDSVVGLEDRLKAALKILGLKKTKQ